MSALPRDEYNSAPWQATGSGIGMNLHGVLLSIEDKSVTYQQAPKEFTTEATYMTIILLAFVILTLISSSIDAYDYLRKRFSKKELSTDLQEKNSSNEVSSPEDEKKSSEKSVWMKNWNLFLRGFSLQRNAKMLLDTSCNEQHLNCLDGFRSLAFLTVVGGHFFAFYINVLRRVEENFTESFHMFILPKGILAPDAFLICSGILNAYSVSRQYHKNKGKISWLSLPLRRIIKVTPVQLIVLGFYAFLFPYLGSGPLWPKYDTNPVCRDNLIWNLLYLNNFLPHDRMCMIPNWYLACLMQLHIISPLFLILLMRKPKMGYPLTVFASIMSTLVSFGIILRYELTSVLRKIVQGSTSGILEISDQIWPYFEEMHIKPYTKFCSYAIGITLGCYIHKLKLRKLKRNSVITLSVGWIIAIFSLYVSMTSAFDSNCSAYKLAAFYSIKSFCYACGLSWIIFMCVTEQGGFLNKFLSCKFFTIFSRLCFCSYLLHMVVLDKFFLSFETLIDYSLLPLVLIIIYLLLWITAISFIFTLTIAMPISNTYDVFENMFQKKFHPKMD